MSGIPAFQLGEPPEARLLVEASAGTGKTHALSSLAVHLLATGAVTTDELLVVTYMRLATAEVRDRIRDRIRSTRALLTGPGDDDELTLLLRPLGRVAIDRLDQALFDYDALTITTIHGFAQRTLAALGSQAGLDPDIGVIADEARLVAEATDDTLAVAAHAMALDQAHLLPGPETLRKLVAARSNFSDLILEPAHSEDESDAAATTLVALAGASVDEARRRRRAARVRNYAELLSDLRDVLVGPHGDDLARQVRGRLRVGLIDEFQDTDALQWAIFDRVFPAASTRLVLVGDPKQAIYRFRGADVQTYVDVANGAVARRALDTNWRSDGALLSGLDALFAGVTFGASIPFVPVAPAPGHEGSRLGRSDGATIGPVEVAIIDDPALRPQGDDGLPARFKSGVLKPIAEAVATEAIIGHLIAHLVDLFENGRLVGGSDGVERAIRPDDVAVLVRAKKTGWRVADALASAGIPAVMRDDEDVRDSEAADQWRALLEAMARPSDARLARAAAAGAFGPLDGPLDLRTMTDSELSDFQDRLVAWSVALGAHGPAEFVGRVFAESAVRANVLAGADGARHMTDIEHLGELFSVLVGTGSTSPEALLDALRVDHDGNDDEKITSRRVETDAPAVQVMTVHKSKGLEFGVVCLVDLHKLRTSSEVLYHDPARRARVRDVRKREKLKKSPELERSDEESLADELRVLYVAATRARHHLFVAWTHETNSGRSPLSRVLFARDDDAMIDPERFAAPTIAPPASDVALELLGRLVARSANGLSVRLLGVPAPTSWGGAAGSSSTGSSGDAILDVARLERPLDRSARRWSFTAITAREGRQSAPEAVPVDPRPGDDEGRSDASATPIVTGPPIVEAADVTEPTSPLAGLPAGTDFGTLVHRMLEQVDFTEPDLPRVLDEQLERELAWHPLDLTPVGVRGGDGRRLLVEGLCTAIDAPLGPAFDGIRLRDLTRGDRLSEIGFEFRLATHGPPIADTDIGHLLHEHLASDDPFRPWAEDLAQGKFHAELAGHLNGSIDLVARVGPTEHRRFVIVDYKTNRLHEAGTAPRHGDYGPERMQAEMARHHYPLQALLYTVALHRYLRWRLPGYRPEHHLGGAAYLFVRGLVAGSSHTPDDPPGVCRWAIPPTLVLAFDQALAGGAR